MAIEIEFTKWNRCLGFSVNSKRGFTVHMNSYTKIKFCVKMCLVE